MTIHKQQ